VLQRGACHLKLGHHTASQGSGSAVQLQGHSQNKAWERLPGTVQKGSVIPAAATSQCREGTAGVRLRRKQDQKEDPEGMGGGRERGSQWHNLIL
jgi:hypothetical protein